MPRLLAVAMNGTRLWLDPQYLSGIDPVGVVNAAVKLQQAFHLSLIHISSYSNRLLSDLAFPVPVSIYALPPHEALLYLQQHAAQN